MPLAIATAHAHPIANRRIATITGMLFATPGPKRFSMSYGRCDVSSVTREEELRHRQEFRPRWRIELNCDSLYPEIDGIVSRCPISIRFGSGHYLLPLIVRNCRKHVTLASLE